jgi:serine/threonine-protein kinase OSR1/STK39
MVEGRGYTEKSDIWSVGITAIVMATGETPFAGMDPLEQVQAIVIGPSPELSAGAHSSALREFVRSCLNRDPDRRPSAATLLKHAFLRKAKGPEFLASALMANLPPLARRFEIARSGEERAPRRAEPSPVFDFDFDCPAEPAGPARPERKPESPSRRGRFTVTVMQRESDASPVEMVASDVNDLRSEARMLEEQGMEIEELLRQTQESIQQLTLMRESGA